MGEIKDIIAEMEKIFLMKYRKWKIFIGGNT